MWGEAPASGRTEVGREARISKDVRHDCARLKLPMPDRWCKPDHPVVWA